MQPVTVRVRRAGKAVQAPKLDNAAMSFLQATDSPAIVLATLNAKYIHASLGLRCLLANMDRHGGAGLRARTQLREFVIQQRPTQIVEDLLALNPQVIGLGIYIWNVTGPMRLAWRMAAKSARTSDRTPSTRRSAADKAEAPVPSVFC